MFDPPEEQLLQAALPWLVVALVNGLVVVGIRRWLNGLGCSLLPHQRQRDIPWNGFGIVIVAMLTFLIPSFAVGFLLESRFFEQVYGPEFRKALEASHDTETGQVARARFQAWAAVAAFPFVIVGIVWLLNRSAGAQPYQMGLTPHRLGRNLALGFVVWLVFMPAIMAFNILVTYAYHEWLKGPPQPHALETLAKGQPLPIDWIVLFLSAVLAAPIQEELLFRGVLQPWATTRIERSDTLMAWCLFLALVLRFDDLQKAARAGTWADLAVPLQPMMFVLAMAPIYVCIRQQSYSPAPAAIFASGLFFGCAHVSVWPTPVPLFLLGMVLGWLAYRTQSLVAPMLLHAMFNAVACLTLLLV